MTTPLIEDGCVVVEGDRIVAVGAYRDLKPAKVDHDIDGVLMPGLINAHTHLELTNITRPPAPIAFTDWIIEISKQIRGDKETFAARRADAVRQGIAQCIKFGVTCVGDITQNVDIVRPILREGPIRSVSFGECLGIGERRWRFDHLLAAAVNQSHDVSRMQAGVTPHAPYTVDREGYRVSMVEAASRKMGWTTHLAETPDEATFLRSGGGAFGDLYERLAIDPGPPEGFQGGPIRWLESIGLLGRHLYAHVNCVDDEELELLAEHAVGVVWCPRTHTYFDRPKHRWADMLRTNRINVCVGTDSGASSPDLNLVDDLRSIYTTTPLDPTLLFRMVTVNPATYFAWQVGDILAGSLADLVAFPTRSGDPLREILETPDMLPARVWIGGVDVARATSP